MRRDFGAAKAKSIRTFQSEAIQVFHKYQKGLFVAPTGSGKSLIYQVPAISFWESGIVLVIAPLIALTSDQIDKLKNVAGDAIKRRKIRIEKLEKKTKLSDRGLQIYFASPEVLDADSFIFRQLMRRGEDIRMLVLDEAQLLVSWGLSFRDKYINIHRLWNNLKAFEPTILCLTADNNYYVRNELIKTFELGTRMIKEYSGKHRRRLLTAKILEDRSELDTNLLNFIHFLIYEKDDKNCVVYCNSHSNAKYVYQLIRFAIKDWRTADQIILYHGGLGAESREKLHEVMQKKHARVIVATSAIGIGVDYEIDFAIHYGLPHGYSQYHQQVGRIKRDSKDDIKGEFAVAILLCTRSELASSLIQVPGSAEITKDLNVIRNLLQGQHNNLTIADVENGLMVRRFIAGQKQLKRGERQYIESLVQYLMAKELIKSKADSTFAEPTDFFHRGQDFPNPLIFTGISEYLEYIRSERSTLVSYVKAIAQRDELMQDLKPADSPLPTLNSTIFEAGLTNDIHGGLFEQGDFKLAVETQAENSLLVQEFREKTVKSIASSEENQYELFAFKMVKAGSKHKPGRLAAFETANRARALEQLSVYLEPSSKARVIVAPWLPVLIGDPKQADKNLTKVFAKVLKTKGWFVVEEPTVAGIPKKEQAAYLVLLSHHPIPAMQFQQLCREIKKTRSGIDKIIGFSFEMKEAPSVQSRAPVISFHLVESCKLFLHNPIDQMVTALRIRANDITRKDIGGRGFDHGMACLMSNLRSKLFTYAAYENPILGFTPKRYPIDKNSRPHIKREIKKIRKAIHDKTADGTATSIDALPILTARLGYVPIASGILDAAWHSNKRWRTLDSLTHPKKILGKYYKPLLYKLPCRFEKSLPAGGVQNEYSGRVKAFGLDGKEITKLIEQFPYDEVELLEAALEYWTVRGLKESEIAAKIGMAPYRLSKLIHGKLKSISSKEYRRLLKLVEDMRTNGRAPH